MRVIHTCAIYTSKYDIYNLECTFNNHLYFCKSIFCNYNIIPKLKRNIQKWHSSNSVHIVYILFYKRMEYWKNIAVLKFADAVKKLQKIFHYIIVDVSNVHWKSHLKSSNKNPIFVLYWALAPYIWNIRLIYV